MTRVAPLLLLLLALAGCGQKGPLIAPDPPPAPPLLEPVPEPADEEEEEDEDKDKAER